MIAALKSTPKGDEYDSLVSLKADLEELINLTNGAENNQQSNDFQPNSIETSNDNDLDDEYALFMVNNLYNTENRYSYNNLNKLIVICQIRKNCLKQKH